MDPFTAKRFPTEKTEMCKYPVNDTVKDYLLKHGKNTAYKHVTDPENTTIYSQDPTGFSCTSARTPCILITEAPGFRAALEERDDPSGNRFYSVHSAPVQDPEKNNPFGVTECPLDHVSLMYTVGRLLGTDLKAKEHADTHTPRLLQGATNIFSQILLGNFDVRDVKPTEAENLPKDMFESADEFRSKVKATVDAAEERFLPDVRKAHQEIEDTRTQPHSLHNLNSMNPFGDKEPEKTKDTKGAGNYLNQIQSSDTHLNTLRFMINEPGVRTATEVCSCSCGGPKKQHVEAEEQTDLPVGQNGEILGEHDENMYLYQHRKDEGEEDSSLDGERDLMEGTSAPKEPKQAPRVAEQI